MRDSDHTIRPATPSDLPHIVRLVRALAAYERLLDHVTSTEADFRAALFGPQPRAHAFIAEVNGTPVGLALWYYTFSTFTGRPDLFLEDLFVEPPHRGKGIGLALLRRLAQQAIADRCRRIDWRVLNWNQPAIDFYTRIGAKPMQDWHVRQLEGDALAALAQGASDA